MPTLKKATLQEIKADASAAPIGSPVEVQFNPSSLKLDLANQIEGGDSYGHQKRQYLGKTSTTLSFDLHFDTADQGTTDAPVSVRTLTAQVEKFLLPKGEGNTKQAPPKCRFHWDELVIDGIIESVSIDFDLFASNGTPLRAKMGVSIKEQDAKYELLQSGPGANKAATGSSDRSAVALRGEAVAEFAARMGLDPSAWRGIADGLGAGSSLSLSAGVSIDFSSTLSASAGVGVSAGVEAGASVSLDASFGLNAGASTSVASSASASTSAGLALAAAGGVGAAIESVASAQAESAAGNARRAFASAVPPSSMSSMSSTSSTSASTTTPSSIAAALPATGTTRPSMPDQSRTPLALSGMPSPSAQAAAPSAPPPPAADPRATSFGFGVPLAPRRATAADARTAATAARVPLRPRGRVADVLASRDPSAPPWTQLPADAVRSAADSTQSRRFPARPCGCRGRCHHGAGTWP